MKHKEATVNEHVQGQHASANQGRGRIPRPDLKPRKPHPLDDCDDTEDDTVAPAAAEKNDRASKPESAREVAQELEALEKLAQDGIGGLALHILRDAAARARHRADRCEEQLDSNRRSKVIEQLYDCAVTLHTRFDEEIQRRQLATEKKGTKRKVAKQRTPRAVEEESYEDCQAREEAQEQVGRRHREKEKDRKEQAWVEEDSRVRQHGSPTENERRDEIERKKYDKQARWARVMGGAPGSDAVVAAGDRGAESNGVLKDQFYDASDDIDADGHHYDDLTHNEFWRRTHPAPLGREKQHPPDKQGLWLPRWLARVTPNVAEQHLLAQLVYYFQISDRDGKIRARCRWKDHLWVYKPDGEMAVETNLAPGTVKNARERLVEKKILVVQGRRATVYRDGTPYRFKVCHYRIDWDRLCAAYLKGGGDFSDLTGDQAVAHVGALVHVLEEEERNTDRGIEARGRPRRRGSKKNGRDDEDDVEDEEE